MPKPFFNPPSRGRLCAVPCAKDLRERLGSWFLVRPIYSLPGDEARVVAGRLGLILSRQFLSVREGGNVADMDKVFESAMDALNSGRAKKWEADIPLPDGRVLRMKPDRAAKLKEALGRVSYEGLTILNPYKDAPGVVKRWHAKERAWLKENRETLNL